MARSAKPSGRPQRGKSNSLRRRVGDRSPKRTFLVFCEGRRTEPEYLEALKREPAVRDIAAVDIQIDWSTTGSVPMTLVRAAAAARRRSEEEEDEIDEVWCIFDVEWPINHPQLNEAIDMANRSGVNLAISNPCFELWLALHFVDCGRPMNNNEARQLRRKHDAVAGKGLVASTYMPLRADAAARALRLTDKHVSDGTEFPHDNPSSGMHLFLEAVERPS